MLVESVWVSAELQKGLQTGLVPVVRSRVKEHRRVATRAPTPLVNLSSKGYERRWWMSDPRPTK